MRILVFGALAFAVIFGGGLLGFLLSRRLPESYNDAGTRAVLIAAIRTVSLLSALVLGLLVATAKNKFDANTAQTERFAADVMSLDRELANYGSDATDIRTLLHRYVVAKIATVWPYLDGPKPAPDDPPPWRLIEETQQRLRALHPQSEVQRATLSGALQIAGDFTRSTWLQKAQEGDHVPQPFVLILMTWLFLLFAGVGLFAPRNVVTVAALLVTALSIASAIALIDDLDAPFRGFVVVSPQPMQRALAEISAP
jgi:anti-sigma factor RsiW